MRAGTDRLDQVVNIALEAGRVAMQYYQDCGPVTNKGADGPVTAADRAAHHVIVKELARLDPDIPVISEEGAIPSYEERRYWRQFWLVDPLDGTKEFLTRNGEFTVNIALVADGCPVLGVVSAPALDTVYFGGQGRGSWKRMGSGPSERICSASEPRASTRVVESRSHPSRELEEFLATLGPVVRVRLGSSLKFCRLAEGEADLYPRFGRTMEWDVAAGDCLYRNATSDKSSQSSPLNYNQPDLSTPRFVIGRRASCERAVTHA